MRINKCIEIDGFWLIIGIFVVMPMIKYLNGDKGQESDNKDVGTKIVISKGNILEVKNDISAAAINTEVKIPIKKGTIIAKKVSPDGGKPEVIKITSKYAITSFDKRGSWDINMYDTYGLIGWVVVIVY